MTKGNDMSSTHVLSLILAVLITAVGTHVMDAYAIKSRVDTIESNQHMVLDYLAADKVRWDKYETIDRPTILNGQRVILKCMYALKHGELDRECDWELWKGQNNKNILPDSMKYIPKEEPVPVVADKARLGH
jgi:hypothetical protein